MVYYSICKQSIPLTDTFVKQTGDEKQLAVTVSLGNELDTAIKQQISSAIQLALSKQSEKQVSKEWMSLGDAAKYLSVSRKTLNGFITQGLKIVIIGGVKRVHKQDIDRFMIDHLI